MKKDGYLLTLGEALSPHRLIPLTRSNTRSLPSNHHPFLNSTSKLVVVAMSLDLQKLSTLQFVAVLPLELVILLLPGGQFQTQLWEDAVHDGMRVAARKRMRVMTLGMAYKFSWRNQSLGGKGKELLHANLLGARRGARADDGFPSFSHCIW
jgi:hypothetical protein